MKKNMAHCIPVVHLILNSNYTKITCIGLCLVKHEAACNVGVAVTGVPSSQFRLERGPPPTVGVEPRRNIRIM